MAKFKGTDGADSYTLHEGKREVVKMLGGDDLVTFGAASFESEDRIDGGTGEDTAVLAGGGFYNLGHGRFTGFETMVLSGEGRFEVYLDDTIVPVGGTMEVLAIHISRGGSMFIDGAAERDGSLVVDASSGDDVLIGTGVADTLGGGQGKDLMTGNEGADTFLFEGTFKGDRWGKDRITDFHSGEDHLVFETRSATSFDQLLLDETRDGLVVRTPGSNSSVLLYGLLARDLHAGDVTFLPVHNAPGMHALALPNELPLA